MIDDKRRFVYFESSLIADFAVTGERRCSQKLGCKSALRGNLAAMLALTTPDAAVSFDTKPAEDMSAAIVELADSDDNSSVLDTDAPH